jgi:hypothetical protein
MSEQVHVGERIMKNIKNKNAKKWESKSKYYLFTNATASTGDHDDFILLRKMWLFGIDRWIFITVKGLGELFHGGKIIIWQRFKPGTEFRPHHVTTSYLNADWQIQEDEANDRLLTF